MEKATKYGYGFLLAGCALPYLIDKLLGKTAAIVTSVVLLILGVAFLIAGAVHVDESARAARKTSKWAIVVAIVLVCGIVGMVWWIDKHPDMQAIIVGSATGEMEEVPHATGVSLNVDVLNSGAPSITKDWALSAKLEDGEVFQGTILHSIVVAYSDDKDRHVDLDLTGRPFLDQLTATNPVPTGGRERGVLLFMFADLPRERIDNLSTTMILSFKDVRGRTFKTVYKFPALVHATLELQIPAPPKTGTYFRVWNPLFAEHGLKAGARIRINFNYVNAAGVGGAQAENVRDYGAIYLLKAASDLETGDKAWNKFMAALHPVRTSGPTLVAGDPHWTTQDYAGPPPTTKDMQQLETGEQVLFLVGTIMFDDPIGRGNSDYCWWLQRLSENPDLINHPIWHDCQHHVGLRR